VFQFYIEQRPCYEGTVESESKSGRGDSNGESVSNGETGEVCDPTWHRSPKVYAACMYLEPGAECPYSLEIYARDYVAYPC